MTGPLLRSGSLTAFHPLGAVGNPVYLAAAQLRAAIARRLGVDVADTFAVPQRNEDGDTIDWYAPKPGPVVPWSAATAGERAGAQAQLIEIRARIESLGGAMQRESDPERQVFGRLLAHVTSFPDDEHVYLVDGRPVVAFWGFVANQAAIGSDSLLNLDLLAAPPAIPAPRRRVPWWVWVLALLLLALAALLALRACEQGRPMQLPFGLGDTAPPDAGVAPDEANRHLANPGEPGAAGAEEASPLRQERRDRIEVTGDRTLIDPETRLIGGGAVETGRVLDADGKPIRVEDREAGEVDTLVEGPVGGPAGEGAETTPGEAMDQVDVAGDAVESPLEGPPVDAAGEAAEAPAGAQPADPTEALEGGTDAAAEQAVPDPAAAKETTPDPAGAAAEGKDAEQPAATPTGAQPPGEETAGAADQAGPTGADAAPEKAEGMPQDAASGPDPAAAKAAPPAASGPRATGASPSAAAAPATRLLNSGWRTATSLQDPKTGLPIQMEYQLKDGAGKVRLKRHDGSVCESGASALVKDGKLVVDSSGNIVCADGTNFGRPTIECEPGKDGKARCRGRYPGGEGFSIDMQEQRRDAIETGQLRE